MGAHSSRRLTPGQITVLIVLAVLFVLVALGVNRAMRSDNQLGQHEKCVWHAQETGQNPDEVCP